MASYTAPIRVGEHEKKLSDPAPAQKTAPSPSPIEKPVQKVIPPKLKKK